MENEKHNNTPSLRHGESFSGWGTLNEIEFLRGLGKFSATGRAMNRSELLQMYKRACAQRTNWGSVDPSALTPVYFEELRKSVAPVADKGDAAD